MGQTLTSESRLLEISKTSIEGIDALFIFGVGEGNLYSHLASWLKKAEQRYLIFIEPEEEIFLKAREYPLSKDPKVRLLYWDGRAEEIFQQLGWEYVFLRFGYALGEGHPKELAEMFFSRLEHYHRGINLLASDCEDRGVKVLTNVLKNLTYLPTSRLGQSLEGKCAGIPAIVCGAGPSLNQAIPLLKACKEHSLVIAGGSAARALNAQGIEPHLHAHLCPHALLSRFLEQGSFEVPFFYQGRLSSDLLARVSGPLFWMADGGNYPLEGWIAAECGIFTERFDGGWSVANFSTALAAHLGCNPIIFVGMDFSCGPDVIYASDIAGQENREELIEIEKGTLYSKRDWLMSAEWISSFTSSHGKIEWINGSSQAVGIEGIEHFSLDQIEKKIPFVQRDMEGIIQLLVSEAPFSQVTFEKVADVRRRILESFEKSDLFCDRLLKVWEKYYPNSPLETGEYAVLELEFEQEICHRYFLTPLWDVWKRPILRASFHPLGQHVHKILFFKKAIEMHLPHLRSFA